MHNTLLSCEKAQAETAINCVHRIHCNLLRARQKKKKRVKSRCKRVTPPRRV